MKNAVKWGTNPYYTSLGKVWEYEMLYGKLMMVGFTNSGVTLMQVLTLLSPMTRC
jgi:hypothetical protein